MTTRNLVPRADGEGHIGVADKKWQCMAARTIWADEIISPIIDAIKKSLGEKAAQTAVEAIEKALATKAEQTYVESLDKKINSFFIPFEKDENGDLMPKEEGV